MIGDQKKAKEVHEFITQKFPHYIEGYHAYWRFLLKKGDNILITKVAEQAMAKSEHSSVPTSLWVETRIMRAKTHIFNDDVASAINTLKDICYILPPFPIENL